ncbi:MAG: hypothetical protein O7G83_20710, partial [Proteobacteria bacterium]|nr:hypothetical protein [Pseudomonadota bacterium]
VSTDIMLFFDNVPHTYRMEVDRTAERLRIYIDNVLQATSGDTSAVGSLANNESMIFAEGVLSGGLDGTIDEVSDFLLGPILFYISLTPDAERLIAVPGVAAWWAAINEVESFKATEPDLG